MVKKNEKQSPWCIISVIIWLQTNICSRKSRSFSWIHHCVSCSCIYHHGWMHIRDFTCYSSVTYICRWTFKRLSVCPTKKPNTSIRSSLTYNNGDSKVCAVLFISQDGPSYRVFLTAGMLAVERTKMLLLHRDRQRRPSALQCSVQPINIFSVFSTTAYTFGEKMHHTLASFYTASKWG